MRVVAILAAWVVVAVLATLFFALGGSIGYRRGIKDALEQVRDRRTRGAGGCRPFPANNMRRRTSGHARPGARARRARWHLGPVRAAERSPRPTGLRGDRAVKVLAGAFAALLLVGVPGTAIGATTARPGEALWKVKLGLERIRVAVTTGTSDNVEVHVDLASARLAELSTLGDDAPAEVVADVSADLSAHAAAAQRGLDKIADERQREQLERELDAVVLRQDVVMNTAADVGCGDGDPDCDELDAARQAAETLASTATAAEVVVADPTEGDEASPSDPSTVAQDDLAQRVVTSSEDGQTDQGGDVVAPPPSDDDAPQAPADAASSEAGTTDEPAPADDGDRPEPTPSSSAAPAASATPSPMPSPSPSTTAAGAASAAPSPGPLSSEPPVPSPRPGSPATEGQAEVDGSIGLGSVTSP